MEEMVLQLLKEQVSHGGAGLEKLIALMIFWTFVKRSMKDHLEKIEKGFQVMADSIKGLSESLKNIENNHSKRLDDIENRMSQLTAQKPKEAQ